MNLEKTIEKGKKRLRGLQRADDRTKKRYLVALSGIAMVLVIGLWFFYLNLNLPRFNDNSPVVEESSREEDDSVFKTFGQGFKNIGDGLEKQFLKFKEIFNRVKEISLEGGDIDFVFEGESLPPTPLP